MTKQILLFISLITIPFIINGQEKVLEINDGFSTSRVTNKESYAFLNQTSGGLMVFLEERKNINAYLIDNNYQRKEKIETEIINSKYKQILGYNIYQNVYQVFFSNPTKKKFGVQTFNFETKKSTISILDFKYKGEVYVETINYNNKIHFITITKNSSDLNIYTFNEQLEPKKNIISLKELEYLNPKKSNQTINAYDLFVPNASSMSVSKVRLEKIEGNNPNVIETTSVENKLYQLDDQLIFSFDKNEQETRLCFINLETFLASMKVYSKPAKTEEGYEKSNSYLFDNKLFQIASSNQKMKFTVLDLNTEKIIKEYKVTKESAILFKNSPIIQEGGGMFPALTENRVREMEKTAKYLRKISSSNLGISVYRVMNKYSIILGGTKEIEVVMNAGPIPGINTGSFTSSFNPTFLNYNKYTATKSTYINCLFDDNMNHLKGDIPKNNYDKLYSFEDSLDEFETRAINVFLQKKQLHFGFFDSKKRVYELYRFQE